MIKYKFLTREELENSWIIADPHFFHAKIINIVDRPFIDEYEMNEFMIREWNKTVKKNDNIFCLGDIFVGINRRYKEVEELCSRLNGKIHLIKGNHDNFLDDFYFNKCGFVFVDHFYIRHEYFLCHYPLLNSHQYKYNKFITLLKSVANSHNCTKIIHGHQHDDFNDHLNHYNVTTERLNYIPIKIKDIKWKSQY